MNKSARRQAAIKKQKRKNRIILAVCVTVVVFIAGLVGYNLYQQLGNRVFADAHRVQEVTLRTNGTFTARLAHETRSGTYSEYSDGAVTTVTFAYDGVTASGTIIDTILTMPNEWDDQHGHGNILMLQ